MKVKTSGGYEGLKGNVAENYVFCGGIRECGRRLDQIERGSLRVQKFQPVRKRT
jgi:hypothetical protein